MSNRQADFETTWAELKQLLEWQNGFGFYLIFADNAHTSAKLRERVQDFVRTRTGTIDWIKPEDSNTALEQVLSRIFESPTPSNAPIWLELSIAPYDLIWQETRREIISALNKRRSQLENTVKRPLFLQLPMQFAPELVTWAPDLWSIRQFIIEFPAA